MPVVEVTVCGGTVEGAAADTATQQLRRRCPVAINRNVNRVTRKRVDELCRRARARWVDRARLPWLPWRADARRFPRRLAGSTYPADRWDAGERAIARIMGPRRRPRTDPIRRPQLVFGRFASRTKTTQIKVRVKKKKKNLK